MIASFFLLSLFLFALFLIIAFSLLCSALLRTQVVSVNILSIFLFSFSNIVLVSEIVGTLSLLRYRFLFLFLHFILAGIAFLVWRKNGAPPIFHAYVQLYKKYKFRDVLSSIKAWPSVWFLALAVGVFYLFGSYLVLKVPPNNYDSMTCHMTRIGYWLQHGNFWPWPTWDYTQQVYPLNAQLLMMWTILFRGWDQLAGFPQWISALLGMVVIFGLARLLGWTRPQSFFAALIWALFPEILLESTTAQNHLIAGVLFACALYFLFLGVQSGATTVLILSGLALALALGTHQLTFFALPGILLAVCMIWLKYRQSVFKHLMIWGIASLVAFLLLGSYMYIVNFSLYGDPFSSNEKTQIAPTSSQDSNVGFINKMSTQNVVDGLIKNPFRYLYSSIDTTGLPIELSSRILNFRFQIGSYLFNRLNIPVEGKGFSLSFVDQRVSEDVAWYGIIGFLIFPPLLFIQAFKGLKRRDPLRLGIIVILITYVGIWSGIIVGKDGNWSPYQGRYYIIMVVILAPFIASILRPGLFFNIIGWVLVITSISIAYSTTVYNQAKPLIGPRAIWSLNRIEKQDLNSGQFYKTFTKVENLVPSNAILGLVIKKGFYEYPLFGKGLTRTLVPIYPDIQLTDSNLISQEKINWILLCKPLPRPQGFIEISKFQAFLGEECQLLKRAP